MTTKEEPVIRRRLNWPLVALVLLVGCRENSHPPITGTSESNDISAWASPAVSAAFERGAVSFDRVSVSDKPQLSRAAAVALAHVMARAASGIKESLRQDRGGEAIDFDHLVPCGDVYYGRPGTIPTIEGQPRHRLNRDGPQWFVTFCSGDVPQLSISVASYATDLKVEGGRVIFPKEAGGEFSFAGIPKGASSLPISPVAAMRIAATETGLVVDSVPELVVVGAPWIPHAAQWRIVLRERPDRVSSAQAVNGGLTRKEVYVGFRLDGVDAVGRDAFVAQVPRPEAPMQVEGRSHSTITKLFSRVTKGAR